MKTILFSLFLFYSHAFAVTPILGTDCGMGATIVGSEKAGKVTLGDPSTIPPGYFTGCTLHFAWPKTPACMAMLEQGSQPGPYGTVTTATTLFIDYSSPNVPTMDFGFVISYMCVGQ